MDDVTALEQSLRKSFAVIQRLKQQLADAQERAAEPIAVVGMSCRFPGGDTPEAFWQTLASGVETLREIPADRWAWKQFFNPDAGVAGTHYTCHGAFLDNVADFDPEFFGISGKEADALDPQHRLLLEVSWEALERAGLATSSLRRSQTGVYVGIGQNDYAQLRMFGGRPERITPYDGTGSSFCFASARLSYVLGLQGPNLVVDTACSSSLVALHLACQALRNGECEQALAGGVHLVLSPEVTIFLSRIQALSPDGRSKAFSADADGYGRGEGCGMLVLKRLADARRDGDRILALLRGTAVNHDGPSSGLTVPNGLAQAQLVHEALRRARIAPEDVDAIEAHGTGTSLGDPIEVAALADVFPREGRQGRPVFLSSVKTNIGHLEAASGIAGVIKTILALQHDALPPHLHCREKNPHIDWERFAFAIPSALTPWSASSARPRIAGVSAFGLGGTNAHVLVSEPGPAAPAAAVEGAGSSDVPLPLVLSAKSPAALAALREKYVAFLERTDARFSDIAYTAAVRRSHFSDRLAIVAADARDAAAKLRNAAARESAASDARPTIAFVFSGQGSQYCGMGQRLFQTVPVFRDALRHCAALIEREAGWSPLPFLTDASADSQQLDQTGFTQPCLFALQYALVSMWCAWGMEPDIVLGHSIGEYAAAWAAGVLDLDDAVRLVVRRGQLMQEMPPGGGMAAVRMSEAEAGAAIARYKGSLSIAAVNGPRAVVVAGATAALDACLTELDARHTPFKRLAVSHAFHSPLMRPMVAEFAGVAERVPFRSPAIEFVPTGAEDINAADVASPKYWIRQIEEPVRFAAAVAALAARSPSVVMEIGPSSSLLALARQSANLPGTAWLPSIDPADELATTAAVADLYIRGCDIRWAAVFAGSHQLVDAPTYAFTRRRCWVDAGPSKAEARDHWRDRSGHPFLGERVPSPLADTLYRADLTATSPAVLADHRVQGEVVYPASAFVEAALAAAIDHLKAARIRLTGVQFQRPLVLPADALVEVHTVVTPAAGGCSIRIASLSQGDRESGAWKTHLTCGAEPLTVDPGALVPAADVVATVTGEQFYQASRARGIDYGPAFQSLVRLDSRTGDTGSAEFSTRPCDGTNLSPLILDAAFQALAAARPDAADRAFVPAAIDVLDFAGSVTPRGRVTCEARAVTASEATCALSIADDRGITRVRLDGIRMRQIASTGRGAEELSLISLPVWEAVPGAARARATGGWLIAGDDEALRARLAEQLSSNGVSASAVTAADVPGAIASARGAIAGVCWLATASADDEAVAPCIAELALVQALGQLDGAAQPRLLFVTRGGPSALWGFGRVVRNELPRLRCTCIDLDPVSTIEDDGAALVSECLGEDEDQIRWRNGARFALRLRAPEPMATSRAHGRLVCRGPGDLQSLQFEPIVPSRPGRGEVAVRVVAAGLNFKDILHGLGVLPLPKGAGFGFDAAGVVEDLGDGAATRLAVGDRVMFSLTPGAIAWRVNARADFVCRIPAGLSFAEGAGIPLPLLTAAHALNGIARIQPGQRVLVHAATGGVGQAAVQIARSRGADVFATASPAKHRFLRAQGIAHVYNSRSSDFASGVMSDTDGRGVDVVLNCLSGDLIQAGLDCTAQGGTFVEIGKTGIWPESRVTAHRPDVRYAPFDLADVARDTPARIGELFAEIAGEFAAGMLRPPAVQAFEASEATDAFRLVSRARHVGKVVIMLPRPPADLSSGVHVVTGGFGALGRSLGRDLIARGVKRLAVITRGELTDDRRAFLETLQGDGVRAVAYTADVANRDATAQALDRAEADLSAGVVAVYHAAGELADATIANQTPASFARAAGAKLAGAWNLHACTRGRDLERFVLFSSAAALMGTPGQSSYAMANAGLDFLAARRRAMGLPALSVNWGPWDAGMAARLSAADRARMEAAGVAPLEERAAWNAMAALIDRGDAHAMVMSADWARVTARFGDRVPSLLRRARPVSSAAASPAASGIVEEVAARAPADRAAAVQRHLRARVAAILGRPDADDIRATQGFFAMGMDSLTSLELRNRLQQDLGCSLPTTLAFDYGTIESLARYLLTQVPAWIAARAAPAVAAAGVASPALDLDELSEADLAGMLARELRGERDV